MADALLPLPPADDVLGTGWDAGGGALGVLLPGAEEPLAPGDGPVIP